MNHSLKGMRYPDHFFSHTSSFFEKSLQKKEDESAVNAGSVLFHYKSFETAVLQRAIRWICSEYAPSPAFSPVSYLFS